VRAGKVLLLAGIWAVTFAAGEWLTRVFLPTRVPVDRRDERALLHRWHRDLGWFPIPSSTWVFEDGTVPIHVRHNAAGFRDREHAGKNRPRLAVLGDSFVWGYDVEEGSRFTDLLAARYPGVEIFNLGVSGYGTDQELLLLKREFEGIAPDAVFLVYCRENDRGDNSADFRYEGYYKPYFEKTPSGLRLKGVPVPRSLPFYLSAHPFAFRSHLLRLVADEVLRLRHPVRKDISDPTHEIFGELQRFLADRRVPLCIGLTGSDPELEEVLARLGVPSIVLTEVRRFAGNGMHWTPEGHRDVAGRIARFLGGRGVLPMSD
jgi:hypothetical protein